MMTLTTAKILLYIALTVGPHNAPIIYATSNSESYVWTSSSGEWTVCRKGFPASDFTRNPSVEKTFAENPSNEGVPAYLRSISRHNWDHHNSIMIFANGNRVEKHGDHAFYIINAGGANERVFTILFPKDD